MDLSSSFEPGGSYVQPAAASTFLAGDAPPDLTPKKPDKAKAPTNDNKPKPDTKAPDLSSSPPVAVKFDDPSAGMDFAQAMKEINRLEQERLNTPAPKMPERPKKTDMSSQVQDLQLWGSIAIAFSALASLRTRTPMTTALNAAAAALTAMRNGQQELFQQQSQKWEEDTKYAMQMFNYEQRVYEDFIDNIKDREGVALNTWGKLDAESELKFKMLTESMKDPVAKQTYDQYGFGGLVDLQKQREATKEKHDEIFDANAKNVAMNIQLANLKNSDEFKNADPRTQNDMITKVINESGSGKTVYSDQQVQNIAQRIVNYQEAPPGAKGALKYTPADAARINDAMYSLDPNYDTTKWDKKVKDEESKNAPQMTDEEVTEYAKDVLRYHLPSPLGRANFRGNNADADRVLDKIRELDPDHKYSAGDYAVANKLKTYYTTGAGAEKIKAMKTLAGHLDTLSELQSRLPNNNLTALQKLQIAFGRQVSTTGAVINTVEEARTAVADEFNKVLIPSGGGTGEDRNRWIHIFDSSTKPQMEQAIKTAKELVHSRTMTELKEALNPKYQLQPEDIAVSVEEMKGDLGLSDKDLKTLKIDAKGDESAPTEADTPAQDVSLKTGAGSENAVPTEAEKKSATSLSAAKSKEEAQKIWDDAPSGAWLYDGKTYRRKP